MRFNDYLEQKDSINRIDIFDLDGTLLNTPTKPQDWKGSWWASPKSLQPPHFPTEDAVNKTVAKAYYSSLSAPTTLTVILTGRINPLKPIVSELVDKLLGSHPHRLYLNEGFNTMEGKVARIKGLLEELPYVSVIHMWEDRSHHATEFKALGDILRQNNSSFQGIVVHQPPDWS